MAKRALVTGITGQDGSYLAELLLAKGYDVFGLVRRLSVPNLSNIQDIIGDVVLIDGDLMDQSSLNLAIRDAQPDEVYNLGAQSFVGTSFVQPVLTGEVTGLGVLRLLEAIRSYAPNARIYQASSSEMFGRATSEAQDEKTPFYPRSPYGIAKLYAYWACVNYREAQSLFVSNGILFNHESPRRGLEFVTRTISMGVAKIKLGLSDKLPLGSLEPMRDWGYAPEYVELMWRILQHEEPGDFSGATGETHSVREFVQEAFSVIGVSDWERYVSVDHRLFRPTEVFHLRGDASKAKRLLGWEPKTKFHELVKIMVKDDISLLESQQTRGRC